MGGSIAPPWHWKEKKKNQVPIHSFSHFPFHTITNTNRIVIVLDQSYRKDFAFLQETDPRIVFADPGK